MADPVQVFRGPKPVCDVVAGMLEANGVPAVVTEDAAGGEHVGVLVARVLVAGVDHATARALIEEAEADLEPPAR